MVCLGLTYEPRHFYILDIDNNRKVLPGACFLFMFALRRIKRVLYKFSYWYACFYIPDSQKQDKTNFPGIDIM